MTKAEAVRFARKQWGKSGGAEKGKGRDGMIYYVGTYGLNALGRGFYWHGQGDDWDQAVMSAAFRQDKGDTSFLGWFAL